MKEIRELIITLSKEHGKTIFLSSHILSEVELIASRMAILDKGTTIVQGPVSRFINPENQKVKFIFENENLPLLLLQNSAWAENIVGQSENSITFQLSKQQIGELNKFLVYNEIAVNAIIPVNTLEEYFLDITGKNK
jgi:ABC-2 type transport system ATP-binding protein